LPGENIAQKSAAGEEVYSKQRIDSAE